VTLTHLGKLDDSTMVECRAKLGDTDAQNPALIPAPEDRDRPRRRSEKSFIAGARYGPISDHSIAVESSMEWPS